MNLKPSYANIFPRKKNNKTKKTKKMNTIKTLDDIKDLSIIIVDKMVEKGIIKDCINTDDQTECDAQDVIREIFCNIFNIENE